MNSFRLLLAVLLIGDLHAQAPDGFNPDANGTVRALATQADGKILIGGDFTTVGGVRRNYLARLNADGTPDISFNPSFSPNPDRKVNAIAVQADGRILVGGAYEAAGGAVPTYLARLNADGTPDRTYLPRVDNTVHSLVLPEGLADGGVLVGGAFTTVAGMPRGGIARLSARGTPNDSFNPNAGGGVVRTLTVEADGRILAGGSFTTMNGVARNHLARLNANGTLDASFNPNPNAEVAAVVAQADGRILIGGSFTTVGGAAVNRIARLNADGTPDATFNPDASHTVQSLAVQTDGKILIGGSFTTIGGVPRNRIARLHPDGTLDASFDPNANSNVLALALQADGKILAAGDLTACGGVGRNFIARLDNNIPASSSLAVTGTSQIDWTRGNSTPEVSQASFERWNGSAWILLGNATRVPDGWRLAGLSLSASGWIRARGRTSGGWQNGSGGLIEQILAYGSPEAPDIEVATESGSALPYGSAFLDFGEQPWPASEPLRQTLTITNTGSATLSGLAIALKGDNMGDFATGALPATTLAPGAGFSLNLTFSAKGAGLRRALLTIASNDPDEPLFEITLGGTLVQADPAFDPHADLSVEALAVQLDGKILMGGWFTSVGGVARNRLARLHADGTVDGSFDPNVDDQVRTIAVQADGKILLAGAFDSVGGVTRHNVARVHADGTLDASFSPVLIFYKGSIAFYATIAAFVPQPDGKILIGGNFQRVNGVIRNRIARLNADGTVDDSFNPDADQPVSSVVMQDDGKILIGGMFSTVGGASARNVARLHPDGTVDTTFTSTVSGPINALAVQADGKTVIGGSFNSVGGVARKKLARLNTDGSLDTTFTADANTDVDALALQADGKILVAGRFNTLGGATRNYLARLNPTGTPDDSFDPNPNAAVRPLALQEDGGILVGSGFTFAGGAARSRIARLLNDIPATSTLVVASPGQIDWTLGGSAPGTGQVTFEIRNGDGWLPLGNATRVAGGWSMIGLSLPAAGQVRARGRTSNGTDTGLVEQTATYAFPDIVIEAPAGAGLTTGLAYDFGAVLTGGTMPVIVTVRNIGAVPLDLGTITITGTNAADFSLSSTGMTASLAPGEQTTFQVSFAPTFGGGKAATLSIVSNDPDENPFTLILFGRGNNAPAFSGYTAATPYQIPAAIPFRRLLAKATDPEGDTLTVLAADATSAHGGGVAMLADSLLYTPPDGFSGDDSFEITIADAFGATATGTVTVQVSAGPSAGGIGNNPPVLSVLPDGKVSVSFQGIPGRTYTVQRSIGGLDDWETLATVTADAAGKVSFTDENPPPRSGFYRLGVP